MLHAIEWNGTFIVPVSRIRDLKAITINEVSDRSGQIPDNSSQPSPDRKVVSMKHSQFTSVGPHLQPSNAWPRRVALLSLVFLLFWVNLRQTTTEIENEEEGKGSAAAPISAEAPADLAESPPGAKSSLTEGLPFGDRISHLNAWAQIQRDRPSAPMKQIPASPMRNPDLIPQHIPIDERQDRALGALRMRVPGKNIEFRTSPD